MSLYPLRYMWLEVTGMCNASCAHCYNASSPQGTHGTMDLDRWLRSVDEAVGLGVEMIQLIGGEPLLHPDLHRIAWYALQQGVTVGIYSNLAFRWLSDDIWSLLRHPGVVLSTSYYSSRADEHDRVTRNRGSYARTAGMIAEVIANGIPVNPSLVRIAPDLVPGLKAIDTEGAWHDLLDMGVPLECIGIDGTRNIGRPNTTGHASPDELCGKCTDGVAAVLPDGSVTQCVFTRDFGAVGNLHEQSLTEVLDGATARTQRAALDEHFSRTGQGSCGALCLPDLYKNCPPIKGCPPTGNYQLNRPGFAHWQRRPSFSEWLQEIRPQAL